MTQTRSTADTMRMLYKGASLFEAANVGPTGGRLRGSPYVYGELTARGIRQLVSATGLAAGDRFVDLGSGNGRIPLHIALMVPGTVCIGIEIDRDRHQRATDALGRAEAKGLLEPGRCEFRNQDLRKADIGGGTVYYANSVCFPDRFLNLLARRIAETPGSPMFATPRKLPPKVGRLFDVQAVATCNTTWSPTVSFTIYRRKARTADQDGRAAGE